MNVFADTAGLFALLVRNDYMHIRAKENFAYFAENRVQLLTSSFVLVETNALLQRRIGLPPVHDLHSRILPLMEVIWVDNQWSGRDRTVSRTRGPRDVSGSEGLSVENMGKRDIMVSFTFCRHFEENGFTSAAYHGLDVGRG